MEIYLIKIRNILKWYKLLSRKAEIQNLKKDNVYLF